MWDFRETRSVAEQASNFELSTKKIKFVDFCRFFNEITFKTPNPEILC
jgi:hypothetical protein